MLFILHLLHTLAKTHNEGQSKFLQNLSLIPPHVGANGREDFFDFENHFLVKTKTRRDYTQLGYKEPNTYGIVKTKESFKFKDIDISFEFTLHDLKKAGKNAGFGFWLTEAARSNPDFYGASKSFSGCGVVIDIEGSPTVRFVDAANIFRKGVPLATTENENLKIEFSSRGNKFSAKLFASDRESLLYEGPVLMPAKVFLSATSFSGNSTATMRIERIFSQAFIPASKKINIRGERKGRKGIIYVLGACSIIGLAYYLYQKEQKSFDLKK
jgi:hypothetical protein